MDEQPIKKSHVKSSLRIYISFVVLLAVFFSGIIVGAWKINNITPEQSIKSVVNKTTSGLVSDNVDFNIFWDAWGKIQEKYVDRPINDQDLFYGAMAGLAASLRDPYSVFFNPESTKAFNQEISGTFEGIGIEIGIKNEQLTVIAPLPNSPAEKSGLMAGDRILKINDVDTALITIDTAVSLIRGEKGTTVDLVISRDGETDSKTYVVERGVIKVESVTWELTSRNIAYLKISSFNEDTESSFQAAVREILLAKPKGIILDLRNNPGGFLDVAIAISDSFIPKDEIIVIEDYGNGNRTEYKAKNNDGLSDYPVVVLVNGGSASASEILAGALQDHKVASIVGEQTFGKGSVQELEEFDDGSSLKLTVAKWLTPLGRSISEEGIKPDVEVELTEDDYNNDLDPQLDKAVEIIEANQ